MGKAPTITSKSSRFTPKTVSNIPSLPSLRHPESEMSSELSTPERLNSPSRLLLSHTRTSGTLRRLRRLLILLKRCVSFSASCAERTGQRGHFGLFFVSEHERECEFVLTAVVNYTLKNR